MSTDPDPTSLSDGAADGRKCSCNQKERVKVQFGVLLVPPDTTSVTRDLNDGEAEIVSDGNPPNLWDADHKEGQELVSLHPDFHQLLMGNFTTLLEKLQFSQVFWAHLLDHGVVDESIKTKIQGAQTRETQVLKLVDHIVNSEMYRFHGFAWAVVNSQQYKLAADLGFDLKVYLDESHFIKNSTFICLACCEYNTRAYILPECGHYVCSPCVKAAQYICMDNKEKGITCPVPDCEKKSEADPNSESAIGLKEDRSYAKLCELVKDEAEVDDGCKDTENKTKPIWHEGLDATLKKKEAEISTYEQKYRRYAETVVQSDQKLRNYVEETSKRMKTWVENWRSEQETFIHHAKIQVQTNHAEGVQWEKVIRDLTIMSHVYPWKLEKIAAEMAKTDFAKLDGASPAVVSYVVQLLSGTEIPKNIIIPRLLDTHATAGLPMTIDTASMILDWKSPRPGPKAKPLVGKITDLDWTLEGHIILSTSSQEFSRLTLDLASRFVVKHHKPDNIYANSVCAMKDGRIYLGSTNKVMVYDPSVMDWLSWEFPFPYVENVLGNGTHVSVNTKHLVASFDNRVFIFTEQSKPKHVINIPFVKKTCFCKNTLVVAAQGVILMNLETKKQQHLHPGQEGYLESPSDVAPFGEDHFLVYDMKPGVVKVFSLTGKFKHTLAICSKTGKIQGLNGELPVSIATYPKEGTPTHLAVGYGSEIQVYSLT